MNTINKSILLFVGLRVKRRRKTLGYTQAQVAEAVGLSRASIANLETGRQDCPITTLHAIANSLEIPLWKLVKQND